MNIAVFCSANDLPEIYSQPAKEFGGLIAKNGHVLVWGASDVGVMKVVADAAQAGGARIVGVTIDVYKTRARSNADELLIAASLGERKQIFLERSDVIIVLPGGLGTLDEVTEILELKKQRAHNKQVVFINSAGFYDGLRTQLEKIAAEGFISAPGKAAGNLRPLSEFVQFVSTPQEAMDLLHAAK